MKILSVEQTREADKFTMQNEPISSLELMERAAQETSKRLLEHYAGYSFLVFAGPGNNGGDGLVIARHLALQGQDVRLYTLKKASEGSEDFQLNWSRLPQKNLPVSLCPSHLQEIPLSSDIVVVDALLGSGLGRPLKGKLLKLVQYLNQNPGARVAIDIPTGMRGDHQPSEELEYTFKATHTLTMGHPKPSMLHRDSARLAGYIEVVDIGLDPRFYQQAAGADFYLRQEDIQDWFSPRPLQSYKGTYGHACIWAGSPEKGGAALLAAEAALRSGCGLLSVAVPALMKSAFWTRLPEAMQLDPEDLLPPTAFQALGCGPGLGKEAGLAERLEKLAREEIPQVWDADALNHLAENSPWLKDLAGKTVLTPHIGEWKRLTRQAELPQDYPEQLRDYAQKHQLTVVLKDYITIIATSRGELYYTQFGNTALAQGGSGDILTGLLTGLLAQGYAPEKASALAVFLQGRAANLAANGAEEAGLRITDILAQVPQAWKELVR